MSPRQRNRRAGVVVGVLLLVVLGGCAGFGPSASPAETTEPRIDTKLAVESDASAPVSVTVHVEGGFEETVSLQPGVYWDFTDRLERSGSYDVRVNTPEDSVEASIDSYEGYRFIIRDDGEIFVTAEAV